MDRHPDIVGALFFGCCALLTAALTRWPSLWITAAINRNAMRQYLERSAGTLRILTAVASVGGLLMAALSVYG
jgi:hypothetical protein